MNSYSEILKPLENCTLCPKECGANRFSNKLGYCRTDASFNISSICIHKGEEPIISGSNGICNVFFSHCNLQCVYCQNHQISRNKDKGINYKLSLEETVGKIVQFLDAGCNAVGFVSPSHNIPQMKAIIQTIKDLGKEPTFVYNTNGYDKVETIRSLEGLIHVYLPDFKYADAKLSKQYSDAADYPTVAIKAIKEMYRQKGSTVIINEETGQAESGLIIRHLVLPAQIQNSIDSLRLIADEISTGIHISLMAQYFPTEYVKDIQNLNRTLYKQEYQQVVDEMENLGFYRGWVQELESQNFYRPDFEKSHPFH